MNKALAIFGQQRFVDLGIHSLKQNIVDFNDYDVFIHTWEDGKKNENLIYELWEPKEIIIEKQINFSDNPVELIHKSIFYSTSQVFKLIKSSDKNYDAIIRTRFDVCLDNLKLDISNFDMSSNMIYAPDVCHNPAVLSDFLMFGNSNNMQIFEDMFDNYEDYKSQGVNVFSGEEIINKAMIDASINKGKTAHKAYLIRQEGFGRITNYWVAKNHEIVTKYLPS